MKKILMAAVALTALAATPAMAADPSSASYTVSGTVAGACGFDSGTLSGTIDFGGSIAPGASGAVSVATPTGSYDSHVYCNTGTGKIAISGGTITHTNAVNTLSYTPVVKLDGGSALANNASIGSGGTLTVTAANLTSSGAVALAGAYSGTLIVTVSPN